MTDPALALRILEALPHAVSVVDGGERLAYANPAFWTSVGVPPGACPAGSPLRDVVRMLAHRGLYGAGDPEEQVEAVMRLDRSKPARRQIGLADGTRSFETVSLPLPGGGFATVAHDITALLRAREEQAARARLLEGTLAGLRGGVARFDAGMRLALHNAAYESLIGLAGGTLRPGMTHHDILAARDALGEFTGSDTPATVAARMEADRFRPAVRERARPSGQVLRFDSQPAGDGGFLLEVTDITALKRAEDEARRRAALLDGVLEALPYGVCLYGPDRRVRMFNASYARMMDGTGVTLGESLDTVIARRIAQGEYDPAMAERVLARFAPGSDNFPVMRRQRPNGTVLENSMARLPDGGVISVFTDVTALHQAEEANRQRSTLLAAVLDAMPHGVCVYGPDRRVAMFNRAYARIMEGAPLDLGEHVDEVERRRIAAGEYGPDYAALSRTRITAQEATGHQAVRRRPNGTVISVSADRLPDGGHISVVTDVTALNRAEEEARGRAATLDAVLNALPDGIVVYGPDRRAHATNPAYRAMLGEAAVRIGETIEEVGERRVAAGELSREAMVELLNRHLGPVGETGRPIRRMRPDGRVMISRAGRLPDGGHIAVLTDVTALHRAEEELRRRAAMLEASYGAMRHGIAIYGPDRRLLAANARSAELTGLPPSLFQPGTLFEDLLDAQAEAGVMSAAEAAERKALDMSQPYRVSRRRLSGRVVEIASDPTPDGGFVVTHTDVTALHRAEEELGRRAAMLEASFAAMRHGIAIFDPDRRLLAVNARTADLIGLPPGSCIPGRTFDELVDEQVALGVVNAARGEFAKRLDFSRPHRLSRPTPNGRMIETVCDPAPDGGFVFTYADVTELHQAQAELRQRAAMQEAMLATIRHGIILYGPDRRLLATNAKTAELTGMAPEDLVRGRLMDELIDEGVARGQIGPAQGAQMKAFDRRKSLRYTRLRPDGRVLDTVSEPTPDGGYVITYSDVTEERTIRAELERARVAAEAASEAKSRFLATMSHELRTPLNAVIGLSEAIGMDAERSRVEEYATMVNEAGRHLLQLVDDILDVARSQTGALKAAQEPVDPAAVIEAAADSAAAAAAAGGLVLVTELPPGLPWLRGDARRLRQVLDKLLSNAVKFTPSGGRVTISAEAGQQGLAIRVADTGIGIPAEERERMFEPFTQLDSSLARRFQGSGLGLHLARTLAAALDASLTLEDPAGPGIVAVLRFPPERLITASEAVPPLTGSVPA